MNWSKAVEKSTISIWEIWPHYIFTTFGTFLPRHTGQRIARNLQFTHISSGKSSLAFDTIYAEGQRRYVESLSSYARMFLGQMEKPDVDYIDGLSPAISIDQKTTSKNPRSTVGTVTEVYDYLRLLWARVGTPLSLRQYQKPSSLNKRSFRKRSTTNLYLPVGSN